MHALGKIEEAAALSPNDPVIAFNQALIRDRFNLVESAARYWDRYLRLDATSPWAQEVRERIARSRVASEAKAVSEVTAWEDPQAARYYVQEDLFARWARAADEDPGEADRILATLLLRSRDLDAATGDPMLLNSAERIREAATGSSSARPLEALVRGHRLYANGSRLARQGVFAESVPTLESAARELRRSASPFSGWAELLLLRCDYQARRYEKLERMGAKLIADTDQSHPSALRGQAWWILGSSRFAAGNLTAAGEAYARAAEEFALLGEVPNQVAILGMQGDLAEWTGGLDAAWRLRYESLLALRPFNDPQRRRLVSLGAAHSSLAIGEPRASLAFQDEAVAIARQSTDAWSTANALLNRAELRVQIEDHDGTQADMEEAEVVADGIADEDRKRFVLAHLGLVRGRFLLDSSPAEARAELQRSLVLSATGEAALLLPEIQVELARCEMALDHSAAAERLLAAALAELSRQRLTVEGDYERIRLSDQILAVDEQMASLRLDRGEIVRSLDTAVRSRASRLRERMRADGVVRDAPRGTFGRAPRGEFRLRLRAGPGDLIAVYALLPERLVIWAISSTGVESFQVYRSDQAIQRQILDARIAISEGDAEAEALLHQLYELLIAPLGGSLKPGDRLLVSPEGDLFNVPFAALRSRAGRFLIEDHGVAYLPSLDSADPTQRRCAPSRPQSVLVVADPFFDPSVHPRLPRLPGALQEAERILGSYPGPNRSLEGKEATAGAMVNALAGFDVVHVAAHGLVNVRDPFHSSLVLAPDPGAGGGDLDVTDLPSGSLGGARTVILAACSSAGGVVSRSEGPVGFAWAFLARGARDVVATLWEVDDRASSDLFASLHREIASGAVVSEALRAAQLSAIRRGAAIQTWAAPVDFTMGSHCDHQTLPGS